MSITQCMYRLAYVLLFTSISAMAQDDYQNPIDGKTYSTNKWVEYNSKKPAIEPQLNQHVRLESTRLLTQQQIIGKNISVDELSAFIIEIKAAAAEALKDHYGGELMIKVTLNKEFSPMFEMAFLAPLTEDLMQNVYDRLVALKDYRTKHQEILFQLHLSIENIEPG